MDEISELEIWQFLRAIETGEIKLNPEGVPQKIYAGNVTYSASNGWKIVVFNDCNDWDYIDALITADGRQINFDAIYDNLPEISNYTPSEAVAWTAYGLPGPSRFRCPRCDVLIKRGSLLKDHESDCCQ